MVALEVLPFSKRQLAGLESVPLDPVPLGHLIAVSVVVVFFILLTWLCVGLRLWTRFFVVRGMGWDDWLMLPCLLFFTAFASCELSLVLIIKDSSSLSADEMVITTNIFIAAESFYVWDMILLKLSLGIFFLRILIDQWERRIVYFVVTLSTLYGFGYFWYAVFYCGVPNAGVWQRWLANECATNAPQVLGAGYTHAGITALTDITLASLPLPMLKRSTLPMREKLVIGGILSFAALGCVASLVRIYWIPSLENRSLTFYENIEQLAIWSTVETGLGITVACAATLRPLVRRFSPWFSQGYTSDSTTPSSNGPTKPSNPASGRRATLSQGSGNTLLSWPLGSSGRASSQRASIAQPRSGSRDTRQGITASAFFLDTVDTIDYELITTSPYSRHSGEKQAHAFDPPATVRSEAGDTLSSRARSSRSNRATWWPLPRTSIVDEIVVDDTEPIYMPNLKRSLN